MDGQGKPTEDRLTLNIEKRQQSKRERQIALYRSIVSHVVGIITAVAELHLGEKVSLKQVKRR